MRDERDFAFRYGSREQALAVFERLADRNAARAEPRTSCWLAIWSNAATSSS